MFLVACKFGFLEKDEYQEMFELAKSISKAELGDVHRQLLEIVTDPSSLEALARFCATKKPNLATDFATKAMKHAVGTGYNVMPLLELVMELSTTFTNKDRTTKWTNIAQYLKSKGEFIFTK